MNESSYKNSLKYDNNDDTLFDIMAIVACLPQCKGFHKYKDLHPEKQVVYEKEF